MKFKKLIAIALILASIMYFVLAVFNTKPAFAGQYMSLEEAERMCPRNF